MLVFPKAKINLGLRITGKRNDGYHDIETIFYPVNLCDALEAVADTGGSGRDVLTVTGNQITVNDQDNLVIKAVNKLRETYNFPFLRIHLHKVIPAGAGLGGGSSDAASMLRNINRIFNLNLSDEYLKTVALQLGSDCPFFIDCQPSYATGRGEILEPMDNFLRGYHIVLLNPGINVSTKEAYANCIPDLPVNLLKNIISYPVAEWRNFLTNDFEKTVFSKYPFIGDLKSALYESGSLFSSMSGSGSTVYGIFGSLPYLPEKIGRYVIFRGVL
jgi:4-diphosphocytidyl-2-C-methyl-D-erythritol kinase